MTALDTVSEKPISPGARLPVWLRLSLRELRSGLSGFYVFVACVALGVMVISGVSALSDALRAGFESQGEVILGGDVTLTRTHTRATAAERSWLASRGRSSETGTMRAMARTPDSSEQALVEIKGVDGAYPLVGKVGLQDGKDLAAAVHAVRGAAVEQLLLERLRLKVGDSVAIGQIEVPITAVIASEPDTITDRLTYGPRILVSLETFEATQLVRPGSLVRWRYALKLNDVAGMPTFKTGVAGALPEAGFIVTDRRDPAPQVTRTLERLRQFLTLIGLTALIVGGVGVANAVSTFVDKRRKVIATFRSLGATSRTVLAIFLTQIMTIAMLGILIGLALGYVVPVVLNALYGAALPIQAEVTLNGGTLLTATAYGLLVTLVFTLWPLGQAELVRASVLFRDEVAGASVWPRRSIIALTVGLGLLLALLAVLSSDSREIALYFCGGLVLVFAVFLALGTAVAWAARSIPRSRRPELALAIGSLGAPGGLTRSVVLSLGLGLSLLVAVALADTSLIRELSGRIPEQSPNYYVLDLTKAEAPAFAELVRREAPDARIEDAPMLRGRLVSLRGTPVDQIKAPPEAQWVLSGDRGLTYSVAVPDGSTVVQGSWWPADYDGEALVSFEAELAAKLGLAVGDSVTVNVLGRNVAARISNLRQVKWESLTINFVMVFSPNTLRAAPHNLLATIALPKDASLELEGRIGRAIGKAFPSVTAIRVKDALDAFNAIFAKVMTAVRVAGSVTLVAGALVLAGAFATAQRRRTKQAVILKTLGATQRRIIVSHLIEYGILATITGLLAVLVGSIAAWLALTQVMEVELSFSWMAVAQALALATGLIALFGGLGTWRVLRARPLPQLRTE